VTPGSIFPVSQAKIKVGAFLFSLVVIFSLVLAACGGGAQSPQQATKTSVLTVGVQSSPISKAGFNLYSSIAQTGVYDMAGFIYEPLYYVNLSDATQTTPLLATSYQWNSDNTQLTFHLRQGVRWNDGQPFSSDDVVFTFNTLKQYPAADSGGVWGYLSDVTAPDASTVVMSFPRPYVPSFYNIATQTPIIPKHIFASVGDPTKFVNDHPVGTGPFMVSRYTDQVVVFKKNPNYWNASAIKVDQINLPYLKDNDAGLLALEQGQTDWAGFFSAGLKSAFLDKDPTHNHFWAAGVDEFGIFINEQHNPLLANPAVRKAVSAAIDRNALAQQGVAGLVPPLGPTGLVLPLAKDYLDPAYANASMSADPTTAQKILTDAGFTKGSDGIFMDKSGKRLSFGFRIVATYSDWVAESQIIQQNLKAAGIEIKIDPIQESPYYSVRANNDFDMEIGGLLGGPTPFYIYNEGLNSKNIGKTNFSRYNNPQVDQLLNQYASSSDFNTQKQIIMQIEKIFVDQQPWVPTLTAPRWFEYTTTHFTGWPDQDNPYATGAPYAFPDNEIVVSHLTPA
jgi:peptide/nickel transport system substrate-binding protein